MPRANYKRSICYAVKRERAAQARIAWACLSCRQSVKSCTTSLYASLFCTPSTVSGSQPHGRSIPHAIKTAPVEGLADSECSAAQHDTPQPRRNGSRQREPTPCSPVHAAPGGLCKFAQNRAVQALQVRPISTTRNALQELPMAISNGLVAFRSTPGIAEQGIPGRPPGIAPSNYMRLA